MNYPEPLDPLVAHLVQRLSAPLREDFEERAGIIEFDGNVPRDEAESQALLDLIERHPEALSGVAVLSVNIGGTTEHIATTDADVARKRGVAVQTQGADRRSLADVILNDYGGVALLRRLA